MDYEFQLNKNGDGATLHRQLVEGLSAEFAALPPGSPVPGTAELKRRFGVAGMTVTRALDELVLRNEIVRFRGRGSFTASSHVRTIYYLIPCPPEVKYIQSPIFDGALTQARKSGIRLLTMPVTRTNTLGDVDWTTLEKLPDYAAVIASSIADYRYVLDLLDRKHCRVALVNSRFEYVDKLEDRFVAYHQIFLSRRAAVVRAVELLVQAGRQRILLLHEGATWRNPIREAFRESLAANGLAFDPELELYSTNDAAFCRARLEMLLIAELEFDGIVTFHAAQAVAAFRLLTERGICVPEDVSIVSLADHPMLETNAIGISAVDCDGEAVGRAAVRILTERHGTPVRETIDFITINRHSI